MLSPTVWNSLMVSSVYFSEMSYPGSMQSLAGESKSTSPSSACLQRCSAEPSGIALLSQVRSRHLLPASGHSLGSVGLQIKLPDFWVGAVITRLGLPQTPLSPRGKTLGTYKT